MSQAPPNLRAEEPLSAYNLTVNNDNTYFVTGSNSTYGVWVHNTCAISPKIIGGKIANTSGKFYPSVTDLRTGRPISFPTTDLKIIEVSKRVIWNSQERGKFIKSWYDKGYKTPPGGWGEYDIHHIKPREFGGSNDFWNLTPVQRKTHQNEFNGFWAGMK